MKTIVIDPVTRIEGHSKITIHLDNAGHVTDTQFHVTQLRGFEKFCEGRPFYEMPSITERICGICPISHLLTSAKACEAIMCVRVCDEIEGAQVWDISARGINSMLVAELNRPWGEAPSCTSCGKCVQVCPTGALAEKGKAVEEMVRATTAITMIARHKGVHA